MLTFETGLFLLYKKSSPWLCHLLLLWDCWHDPVTLLLKIPLKALGCNKGEPEMCKTQPCWWRTREERAQSRHSASSGCSMLWVSMLLIELMIWKTASWYSSQGLQTTFLDISLTALWLLKVVALRAQGPWINQFSVSFIWFAYISELLYPACR